MFKLNVQPDAVKAENVSSFSQGGELKLEGQGMNRNLRWITSLLMLTLVASLALPTAAFARHPSSRINRVRTTNLAYGGTASTFEGKTTFTGKSTDGANYKFTVPQSRLPYPKYQAPAYRDYGEGTTRYYYPINDHIWFSMWLMGSNHYGTSAPDNAVQVSASEVGPVAAAAIGDKKVVPIDEQNEWGKYSTADKAKVWSLRLLPLVMIVALGVFVWMYEGRANNLQLAS